MVHQQGRGEKDHSVIVERAQELKRSLRHAQAAINKAIALLTDNEKGVFDENEVLQGTVKWFSAEKGYGFITVPERGDIFVHHSEIEEVGYKQLTEGELVELVVKIGLKGPEATQVRVLL